MRKFILAFLFFSFLGNSFAQTKTTEVIKNSSLRVSNPSEYPFGVNIDIEAASNQRWAREFNFSAYGAGNLFSLGLVANGGNIEYGYIGGNNQTSFVNHQKPWMSFLPNGNIGIGTVRPAAKLDVRGKVIADEVEIKVNKGADFVFKPDYNLKPLSEVEAFVRENQHLPEIPSEKEMQENGLNVNDMQIKLLQKIEELTLYVIQQDKKIAEQSKRIAELENK